jgi:HD-GYP domain-containing protein (c-di-GMP phosphodiesterase class II)
MIREASLNYTGPGGAEQSCAIGQHIFRIGRLEENDLSLDNPYVSRSHIEIITNGTSYHIRDLGSTSGTFVNDERVHHRRLKDGDVIRLGRGHGFEMVFHCSDTGALEEFVNDLDDTLQPVLVVPPENTRFLNTARLPDSGSLTGETLNSIRVLYEFMSELLVTHSPKELSARLADFLHRTLKAERCAVLLYDQENDQLEIAATSDPDARITPSSAITNLVFNENVSVLSHNASADERFATGDSVRFQSIRSVMCAPIGSKTRVWGVCYVDNLSDARDFNDEALDFLTAVARHSGVALENLHLLDEQRRSLESFMRTLAASLDARDDNTAGHSARVAAIAAGVARVMELSEEESRLIYYAGLLHDYGKIGVRDDVLLKPSELTDEEYAHVKEHPLTTFRLLSKMRFPEDLADVPVVAAAHHERWDGSGYPHGLRDEEIPLGSRIVAVADAYDAITEDRCYHEGWSPERALVELAKRSGTYFDPDVIDAFVEYFEREIKPRNLLRDERKALPR